MIDEAGGLNKAVGKGFKFHIKNFKEMVMMKTVLSPLSTHTDIVNPSPAMTDEGMPIYYNTASFYA